MTETLALALGGALGSVARYWCALWLLPISRSLPIGTIGIGICGGFTTFSSFSLQALDLLRSDATGRALVDAATSVLLCLASVAAGHYAAAVLNSGAAQIAQIMIEKEAS